jgi:cysteine desulfurase / selenocysteine lyase
MSAATDALSPITDMAALRGEFPALHQTIHGQPLAYLDNAASAQCPRAVIDAVKEHRQRNHANVHRGVHTLSERSTAGYEGARDKVRTFINAARREEIIFTSGTTESINLVAAAFGGSTLRPGDEVLVTWMEHHSNIVPWQLICERQNARLVPAPINDRGELDRGAYSGLLSDRTKIVALAHVSNALGTINPVSELITEAHAAGAVVVIDGAQAAPHLTIDVQQLDCDFYAFSGHKMFGPTGIGVLYGKQALLERMPPYKGGGEMILTVSFEGSTYNSLPYKFEAGTPNITGAIGLGAAIEFLARIDRRALERHEMDLLEYATAGLGEIPGYRIVGTAVEKTGVLSFTIDGMHPHDIGTIVDQMGVAIRTGHHCAMPVMDRFGVAATARASFAFYNNRSDVDQLLAAVLRAKEIFA